MKQPSRGEVWIVDLGLAAKVRPCLVLSVPYSDDERALVTLVPHTTSVRNSRFECSVSARFLKPGAFDGQGIVTVPASKLLHSIGRLSAADLSSVEQVVANWLGLELVGA